MRTEGEDNGEWIIVDCGAAVVHIMQPAIREYYHLEEIWGGKSVKMKFAAAEPTRLVKAADETPHASGTAVSARYLATSKTTAKSVKKRATAKRPAAPRKPAAKAPASKTPARKPAPRKAAARTTAARKTGAGPRRS
jgi:ribosome-associated protein